MYKRFWKRFIDTLLSLIAFIILSPLLLITALAVKISSPGPVLFKQQRLGLHGKVFTIYKFRSMTDGAEHTGSGVYSGKGDARVTKVGKIIRATSIDELPQLFNIIKGDMSVVGPRPERPELTEKYEREMPEFKFRLKVKAGLTGYAQVTGVYDTTPYDKLKMDLMYIERYSMVMDLRIILMTIKTMISPGEMNSEADKEKY